MSAQMFNLMMYATMQTLIMVLVACFIAVIVGLPLGVILTITRRHHILEGYFINRVIAFIVNVIRSVPFIILMVAIMPLTKWIVGTSIGTAAAIVPLSLAAIPFFARMVETVLNELPSGLLQTAQAIGASTWQTVMFILLPEAMPGIVRALTITLVACVGYTAMAGTIGGGGLGDVAIRFGYQRFEPMVMLVTVFILIVLVQLLQWSGDRLANYLARHSEGG